MGNLREINSADLHAGLHAKSELQATDYILACASYYYVESIPTCQIYMYHTALPNPLLVHTSPYGTIGPAPLPTLPSLPTARALCSP
jgi:hypothetical protein